MLWQVLSLVTQSLYERLIILPASTPASVPARCTAALTERLADLLTVHFSLLLILFYSGYLLNSQDATLVSIK